MGVRTGVDDELGELRGVLDDLTDGGGGVLAHQHVVVLETQQREAEDTHEVSTG